MPMRKIIMFSPCDMIEIQKNAGPWLTDEFIDLTTDVTQVNVRAVGIAHVDGVAAAEINANVGRICLEGTGICRYLDRKRKRLNSSPQCDTRMTTSAGKTKKKT